MRKMFSIQAVLLCQFSFILPILGREAFIIGDQLYYAFGKNSADRKMWNEAFLHCQSLGMRLVDAPFGQTDLLTKLSEECYNIDVREHLWTATSDLADNSKAYVLSSFDPMTNAYATDYYFLFRLPSVSKTSIAKNYLCVKDAICLRPIGLDNDTITQDSQITASGFRNVGEEPYRARRTFYGLGNKGWCSPVGILPSDTWWSITFDIVTPISGIIMEGASEAEKVLTFSLSYTCDGVTFNPIPVEDEEKEFFNGNTVKFDNKVTRVWKTIGMKELRLVPLSHGGTTACMKIELLGCGGTVIIKNSKSTLYESQRGFAPVSCDLISMSNVTVQTICSFQCLNHIKCIASLYQETLQRCTLYPVIIPLDGLTETSSDNIYSFDTNNEIGFL